MKAGSRHTIIGSLAYLAGAACAVRLPGLARLTPQHVEDASRPQVTAPPSLDPVDLRSQRWAGDLQCASSCVSAAVVKLTDCRVDDYACGCQTANAYKILYGAETCLLATCGYQEFSGQSTGVPRTRVPAGLRALSWC